MERGRSMITAHQKSVALANTIAATKAKPVTIQGLIGSEQHGGLLVRRSGEGDPERMPGIKEQPRG